MSEKTTHEVFKQVLEELGFANHKPDEMTNSDYWMCTERAMEVYAEQFKSTPSPALQEAVKEKQKHCERCEKDVDEVFPCERCETMICDDCTVPYDQFSQVDYTLCKECKDNHEWDEE